MHLKIIKIGEFFAAILILKMEENIQDFQCIMLYYFKKGKNTTEMQEKNFVMHWECVVIDKMCQVVCKILC